MSNIFKAGKVIAPDAKWTGDEPDWHGWETWSVEQFYKTRCRALRFYNYYLSALDLRPMVLDWMKKNGYTKVQISQIKDAPPYIIPTTVGKLVRCMERGMPSMHPQAQEHFDSLPFHETPPIAKDDADLVRAEISKALSTLSVTTCFDESTNEVKKKSRTTSPLDKIKDKVNKEIIILLEEMLDTWATTKTGSASCNMTALLRDTKTPALGCKTIADWINRHLSEFSGAFNKVDPQLVEGYSHFPRPELRKIVKTLETMLADVLVHAKIKNSNRKPRQKKVKDATKQVSRLKYQMHSADWNIDSVSPSRLPTAQCVLLFNTKIRALSVYYASGAAGFEVKGTTLKGFDKGTSFSCTLRKPQDVLSTILSSRPKQLEKYLDTLKTKKKAVNGRINEQTIILKVIEHKL
jgi:hypothetical protein